MWDFTRFGDRPALIDAQDCVYSYRQLAEEGDRLAAAVGGRCLTMALCTNTPGSVLGYTAFLEHGIVPILAAAELDRTLLEQLLEHYRPDYLWAPEKSGLAGERVYTAWGYDLIKTAWTRAYPLYDELALLLTTSGSTGSPKLVRQSYANLRANTASIVEYLHLDETERPITTLPMNYTYGLSILNTHLFVGASIILTEASILQKEFWQAFRTHGATSFGGVPYTYEMLDKLRFLRMELPTLRTMTQAGGKLSVELHKKFAEYAHTTGRSFVVMYGQTEATARMAYLPPEKAIEKCGSMGVAIPGGRFRLIDVNGETVTASEVTGELVYEGENVTLGYAESGADLIRGDERGGVLVTGDMAKMDADGYYYIVGRKKRFLKMFGSRVNLDETERLVRAAFPQTDCACGGVDDRMFVFLTDSGEQDSVKKYLSDTLHLHPSAFRTVTLDAIPRSDAGKTLYSALTPYYEA